jgi:molecular chaperone DnaK
MKFNLDPRDDPRGQLLLTEMCEKAKRELSERIRTIVDFSHKGRSLSVTVSRSDLERLTADLLQRTIDTTELVLELSGVKPTELDAVLLVGGSTRMPSVSAMLEKLCGRAPSTELDPQLAVAQGAAIHAAILEAKATQGKSRLAEAIIKRLQSVSTTDVNSHSLGVELTDPSSPNGKRNHIMIRRNSKLPTQVQQRFVTSLANPGGIRIRLLEGEAADVTACTFIGDFRITNLPANLPAGSPVEVTYKYDASRRVHVEARELTGGQAASVDIVWEGAMNHAAVMNFRELAAQYQVE